MRLFIFWLLGTPAAVAVLLAAFSLQSPPARAENDRWLAIDHCTPAMVTARARGEPDAPCRLPPGG